MQKNMIKKPELVCPAGTPASLRTAVDAGADAVYCGFQNETNARNFPGLNFTVEELESAVSYAHQKNTKVLLAINTFPSRGNFDIWEKAIQNGMNAKIDSFIVADIGVASFIKEKHPEQRMHLSVQAGASSVEAIKFYCEEFNIKRVVLPRILTIPEIKELKKEIHCEIETFIFGNHGLMAEGRCSLTNYVTGISTNMDGACSPPSHVTYEEKEDSLLHSKLGHYSVDCFSCSQGAGYPTVCKGRYFASHKNDPYYAFEEPISLNLSSLLPNLIEAGVDALKIEGRQRSKAYIHDVVSSWRKAVDDIVEGREFVPENLIRLTEGQKETAGAYQSKRWR